MKGVCVMRKIRWGRVFGAVSCLVILIGGSVLAYSEYANESLEIKKLQEIYDYDVLNPKKEAAAPIQKATAVVPKFPLPPEITQANEEKIKKGEFVGIKAVVFKDRKSPGQEPYYENSSSASYYDNAYWGAGIGVENKQYVRVKLSDSDRTKLDLLSAQHNGQYAGFEIEFYDNDGHFTINRLVLSEIQQQNSPQK